MVDASVLKSSYTHIYLFNDDEWQVGAWMYSSSRHVERTNSRWTANERLQTNDKQLTKDCRRE